MFEGKTRKPVHRSLHARRRALEGEQPCMITAAAEQASRRAGEQASMITAAELTDRV
jgi:hypothetical protein